MFGGKKKRALRRVKTRKMRESYAPAAGDQHLPGYCALTLLLFALVAVLIEQVLPSILGQLGYVATQLQLAPVRLIGYLLLVSLGAFVVGGYLLTSERRILEGKFKLLNYGVLCLSFFAIARLLLLLESVPKFLTPVPVLAILLVVLYSQRLASVGVLAVAFLVSVRAQPVGDAVSFDFQLFIVNTAGAMVGIFAAGRVDTRTRLIKVGGLMGLGQAAGLLFAYMVTRGPVGSGWHLLNWGINDIQYDLGWCLISGIGAGFILSGALPFVERFLRLTTDIRLKELSDLNQPILRKFLLEAPGSYHHSLIVATLCEAAASALGANPLLARVGAYFHDIGKLNKPDYFTENELIKGSRHATLSPTMSTLVIIAHVKDGVEIAENLGLPSEVISIVREHHGTSLVEYFYKEALLSSQREEQKAAASMQTAKREALKSGVAPRKPGAGPAPVEPVLFRYPGPKPSSKEAAIVHLGDAVEATTRTLVEPSPHRISEVVTDAVRRRLNDGQLDESRLTLTDIRRIEETFTRVLVGIFHTRIKYQADSSTTTVKN